MNMQDLNKMEDAAGTAGDLLMAAICQIAQFGEVREGTLEVLSDAECAKVSGMTQDQARAICADVFYGKEHMQ